jgi:nucleotide-binding universal stress UspA family protein
MTTSAPILAATDFSAPSRHAADRAARLAQELGAPLSLMHVTPGSTLQDLRQWLGAGHAMEQALRDDARRQLQQLADELVAQRGIGVRTVEAAGPVLDCIDAEARQLGAGLLVLGARGVGFLRRLVLGTTSERLVRRAACPVLVVRQSAHEPYRRALVAVDFSPWSAQALAVALRVAPRARPVLLSAYQVPFQEKLNFAGVDSATIDHYRQQAHVQAVQGVHGLAAALGLKPGAYDAVVVEGDASQRIVEQEHDCDLVVLGKHGRSATEDLLLGSVTQHVLAEGSADVLVSTRTEAATIRP